jgi:hypothetical protein
MVAVLFRLFILTLYFVVHTSYHAVRRNREQSTICKFKRSGREEIKE